MLHNLPYEISFVFSSSYYTESQKIVEVGGVLVADEILFEIYLVRVDNTILSYYKSQLVDNVYLYPITSGASDIQLSLYSGGNTTDLDEQTAYSVVYPDDDGYFQFTNIEPGQYILSVNDTDNDYSPYVESDLYIMGDSDSMN